ncbi:MAG: D-alanyl-D-alanine carboxypeptidase, partial [Bacilli bacterium]|nr:D-alanyl-D-alanine carboxypeptidase [Bacilli bacterium]
ASISKIMTAFVAIENADIDKKVVLGDEVLKAYGSGIYIKKGEEISIKDLLYGLMLRSGNDAALAIAYHTTKDIDKFVDLMNQKALELGMSDTIFNNPSGLDEGDAKGNFSSAYDMAILMSYAMQNSIFKDIVGTKSYTLKTNKNVYKWKNKNKLLFSYKHATGGKTGFTKKAKRTLVTSASRDGLNLTVVTINDGSDWSDHKSLYEEAFKKYTSYTILNEGTISILGENYYKNSRLFLKKSYKYPLLESERDIVRLKFNLEKKRSFKSGNKIGNVNVYIGDKKVHRKSNYVDKRKINNNFINSFTKWFRND